MQHLNSPGAEPPSAFLREIVESDAWPMSARHGARRRLRQGAERDLSRATRIRRDRAGYFHGRLGRTAGGGRSSTSCKSTGSNATWKRASSFPAISIWSSISIISSVRYCRPIQQAVKPGGHVIFETYLIDQAAIGHPQNPDYLLQHNELLDCFRGFRVLSYHEGRYDHGSAPAFRAGIFAQRIQ